jgi:hypothetical protein
MDWVLDHLQVLFVIAVAVVAVLQKLKRTRSREAADEPPAVDPEQAERTRRIQEEIRRRIMERRGLASTPQPESETLERPPPLPAPPPLIEEVGPFTVPPSLEQTMEESRAASAPTQEFEHQQRMLQQFRELEAAREAAHQGVTSAAGTDAAVPASGGPRPANRVPADLRSPAGLRRAVVLREILGPPVGLR